MIPQNYNRSTNVAMEHNSRTGDGNSLACTLLYFYLHLSVIGNRAANTI